MKNIWCKHSFWRGYGRLRRQSQRWCWLLVAMGLMAWIIWLEDLTVAAELLAPTPEVRIAQVSGAAQPEVKTAPEDLKSYPIEAKPVRVSIGLHVSNLANIDQSTESFDVAGYLLYTWRDSRLAYQPQSNKLNTKDSSLDQIWHPALEMVNTKASATSDINVEILPDGTVMAQERFIKTLSSALELQKFPFDKQSFDIALESLKYGKSMIELVAAPTKISIGKDKFVSLSEWKLEEMSYDNGKSFFPPEKQEYSRVTVKINAQRIPGFYIFKVITPLLLITIASWSVFWLKPQEFSTQISVAFTNLLTVVALLLVINDKLPRVGYLTFLDGFTMICFVSILFVILELVVTHRLVSHDGQNKAEEVHRLAQWLMPIGFVLSNLILLLSMNLLFK